MSEEIDVQQAIGMIAQGACYGNHTPGVEECDVCMIAEFCEPVTAKRRAEEEPPKPKEPVQPQEEVVEEVPSPDPFDYLLETMRGKCQEKVQENDAAICHAFGNDTGLVLQVIKAKASGKVKFVSCKGSRVVELESVEQVETLLSEML